MTSLCLAWCESYCNDNDHAVLVHEQYAKWQDSENPQQLFKVLKCMAATESNCNHTLIYLAYYLSLLICLSY